MELLFEKKKKAREEEVKKNEGVILKFVNISLQFALSSANEREDVSSFSKSLPHTETEKTVKLEQNNQEVIIKSIPTNETLIAKDKIDDVATCGDVATTWLVCGYLVRSDNSLHES